MTIHLRGPLQVNGCDAPLVAKRTRGAAVVVCLEGNPKCTCHRPLSDQLSALMRIVIL